MQNLAKQTMEKSPAYQLALTGLMAALLCILGPVSLVIPVSPVPISLGTLVVYFAVYLLHWRLGTASCLIYLLLGLMGLPVFTGFTGGPGKLFGPTGGYLIGYIFLALLTGFLIEKWKSAPARFLAMVLGTAVLYLFGTVWLAHVAGMGFSAALAAGVLPFIPGDLVKMAVVILAGTPIEERLKKGGLL